MQSCGTGRFSDVEGYVARQYCRAPPCGAQNLERGSSRHATVLIDQTTKDPLSLDRVSRDVISPIREGVALLG